MALAMTTPTTMAGVVTLANYIAKCEADGVIFAVCRVRGFRQPVDWSSAFHRTLSRALSKIAA
jgi:hypothetical protein